MRLKDLVLFLPLARDTGKSVDDLTSKLSEVTKEKDEVSQRISSVETELNKKVNIFKFRKKIYNSDLLGVSLLSFILEHCESLSNNCI